MVMRQDTAVDGFRLAYERAGPGLAAPAVLLLHGWPGDRTDYREVAPLLSAGADVVVPDLRGFGESDKHRADPARQYTAAAQARSVIGLIEELTLARPVLAAAALTGLDGAGHFSPLEAPAAFAAAISAAAGTAVGGRGSQRAVPPEIEVPADLAEALAHDAVARASFEGMPPSHRREWVRWVAEAQKADTRARRIAKTVHSLREGKRR